MQGTKETPTPPAPARPQKQDYIAPDVNIFETRDGYLLEAEMPGVSKDGLEITLENNEIVIIGHRAPEPAEGEALFRERSGADFCRVFELDPSVDGSKVSARIEQGVLTLTLPKSENVKPRKIKVEG